MVSNVEQPAEPRSSSEPRVAGFGIWAVDSVASDHGWAARRPPILPFSLSRSETISDPRRDESDDQDSEDAGKAPERADLNDRVGEQPYADEHQDRREGLAHVLEVASQRAH